MRPYHRAKPDEILERLKDQNPDACYPTDMKDAILGIIEIDGEALAACSKRLAIDIQVGNGMDRETAIEYLEFNTFCARGYGFPEWIDDID